jgi:uncharacterized repeat protein (TIGR02543 family)
MKKITSLVLALAMTLSLLGVYALADEAETVNAPFTLSVKSQDESSVVISLNVSDSFQYGTFTVNLTSDGLPTPTVSKGANFSVLNAGEPVISAGACITAADYTNGASVTYDSSQSEVLTYTYDISNVDDGTYNVTATFSAAATIDDDDINWNSISTTVTIGTPDTSCKHTSKEHHLAVSATCTTAGNVEYWTCNTCGKNLDANDNVLTTVTIAALGHNYVNGTCDRENCGAIQPSYTVYYELYDSTGANKLTDGDGMNLYVFPGTTYMAKVYISANAEQELRYFDINLTYDSTQIEKVTNDTGVQKYNTADFTTSGAIEYYLYQRNSTSMETKVTSDNPLQVAQFTFTVKDSVANGDTLTLGFSADGLNEVSKDSETDPTNATTTALQMAAKVITITWNGNGGKFGTEDTTTTTVAYNGTPEAPTDTLTRNGYTQDGWGTSATNTTKLESFNAVTEDTTYYAKWNINTYTITYALNDGKLDGVTDNTGSYTIENGALVAPTRDGYTFSGWTITAVDSEDNTDLKTTTEPNKTLDLTNHYGDVTLTANWTATEYKISYAEEYTYEEGTTKTEKYTTVAGTLTAPVKSGYTFAGWEVTAVGTGSNLTVGNKITDNSLAGKYGDVTLKALWTVNANASWYTYDYAPSDYAMLIVSAVPDDGNGVYVTTTDGDVAMYSMTAEQAETFYKTQVEAFSDDANIYVYLLPYTENAVVPTITIKAGPNESLVFNGIMNGTTLNYNDASIVNEMVIQNTKGAWFDLSKLDIQRRLQADMNHDGKADAGDVTAIVNMIQGNAT